MKFLFLLVLVIICTGCESYYIRDNYNKSSCTHYDMPYIMDYVNNGNGYETYNDFVKSNYQTDNDLINGVNLIRAYKTYCNAFQDSTCFRAKSL